MTGPILTWAILLPPSGASVLTPWSILTATAGLIAFHIGLYTLVGRERKSPYIINSVFPIFLLCPLIAAIALGSALLPAEFGDYALKTSALLLVAAFVWSVWKVYQVSLRFVYFVDEIKIRDLPFIRQSLRFFGGLQRPSPSYRHNPNPLPEDLKAEILGIFEKFGCNGGDSREAVYPQSLALAVRHQGQGNQLLAELSLLFLRRDYTVQYLTASRHPIEFVGYLKYFLQEQKVWKEELARHIVVIDAYSSHFAFLDSIYPKKDRELDSLGITHIRADMTYAGMHSASSKAFNAIKKQVQNIARNPTLVIYEDTYALTDLESAEQYRIFVRHVMPSERMWDGMFTVFLESAQPENDWTLLQAYASMRLDLRSGSRSVGPVSSPSKPKLAS